jgi:hypothetical protein
MLSCDGVGCESDGRKGFVGRVGDWFLKRKDVTNNFSGFDRF